MSSSSLRDVLSHFDGVKTNPGGGYMARCPAHADKNPSLKIDQSQDGKILLKCFAGCDAKDIVQAAGLTFDDLFPDKPKKPKRDSRQMVAKYNYHDTKGNVLFRFAEPQIRNSFSAGQTAAVVGLSA